MFGNWQEFIKNEMQQEYAQKLMDFLEAEYSSKIVYPKPSQIFRALDLTPLHDLKVVILGQDPYFNENQANGLAFSVNGGEDLPPSLKNIYKELKVDLDVKIPKTGDLTSWATQGVLLLNTCLTVQAGRPASHRAKGWETFTDRVIERCNEVSDRPLAFLLWGNWAKEKASQINGKKHLVLKAAHPSPLSAHNGFFGCRHFSKVNMHLKTTGQKPINWEV